MGSRPLTRCWQNCHYVGRTDGASPRGDEGRDFFRASPRERIPRSAVSIVVDDAALALEPHLASRRSQPRAMLEDRAGIETALATALDDRTSEVRIGRWRHDRVDVDRASS